MARIYVWEYVNKSPLYLFPLDFCSGVFFTSLPHPLSCLLVPRPTFQGTRGAYKLLKCRCKYLTASCCQFKLKTLPQKLQLDKQTRHKLLQSSLTPLLLPALTALPPQFTHMIWLTDNVGQMDISLANVWINSNSNNDKSFLFMSGVSFESHSGWAHWEITVKTVSIKFLMSPR